MKFCFCSGPRRVSCPTKQDASVPMDVSVEMSEQFQADPMEVGPSEIMEIPQPAASPGPSVPEKRLYKSRSVLLYLQVKISGTGTVPSLHFAVPTAAWLGVFLW